MVQQCKTFLQLRNHASICRYRFLATRKAIFAAHFNRLLGKKVLVGRFTRWTLRTFPAATLVVVLLPGPVPLRLSLYRHANSGAKPSVQWSPPANLWVCQAAANKLSRELAASVIDQLGRLGANKNWGFVTVNI